MNHTKRSSGPRELYPEDAADYMKGRDEQDYLLLDVRQPKEYEQGHLPGASLISLPELPDALAKLDRNKPTLVYCAMGGRSQSAARFLHNRGFQDVMNIIGGIQAWEGGVAEGPAGIEYRFISGTESIEEIVRVAYAMEYGLGMFHQMAADRAGDGELKKLLELLAKVEWRHMANVLEMLPPDAPLRQNPPEPPDDPSQTTMEGGMSVADFMEHNARFLQSTEGVLDLAMTIETQALDLYIQMAHSSQDEATRKILLKIAHEEREHLAALGRLMDEKAG